MNEYKEDNPNVILYIERVVFFLDKANRNDYIKTTHDIDINDLGNLIYVRKIILHIKASC